MTKKTEKTEKKSVLSKREAAWKEDQEALRAEAEALEQEPAEE